MAIDLLVDARKNKNTWAVLSDVIYVILLLRVWKRRESPIEKRWIFAILLSNIAHNFDICMCVTNFWTGRITMQLLLQLLRSMTPGYESPHDMLCL